MARTQAADYNRKREAITEQAAKLFARLGFGGASISELASSCDVSKSLIYHYYASKEEILFGVMTDHIDALLTVTQRGETSALSPEQEFRFLARALLRCYTGAAEKQKVLLYELPALPKQNRDEIIAKQRTIISRMESVLIRCKPTLAGKNAHLRATVMLFFGMLNWTHTWYKSSGPISRNELADMAANTILKSLN